MISENQLLQLMADLESDRVERTISANDTTKFREAICAFSNDFPNHRQPGYLLIGVEDKSGKASGLKATDAMLRNLAGLRQDGEVLPQPAMSVARIILSDGSGDVIVVEVHPSDLPPVRCKGRIHIRVGPRRALANESEERMLSERRVATARTFDARPCPEATLEDLAIDLFLNVYRAAAVAAEVVQANKRTVEEQLAALRFYDLKRDCPTHAGLLAFGKNPRHVMPGAYVQYLKLGGDTLASPVLVSREFHGNLMGLVQSLDALLDGILEARPVRVTTLRDETVWDFPRQAVRELLLNAICHRNYESNAPVRFHRFAERIAIHNPGGLYGEVSPENFPRHTDYRNPIVAEVLKVLGYVNRFGRGVLDAQQALQENGNKAAVFTFDPAFVSVTLPKSAKF
ncbi:MAG: RNA-binding domain-containing protein [Limisphaerales bacterium]